MGVVTILVMRTKSIEQYFVFASPGGYTLNLVTVGAGDLEGESFEIVDGQRRTMEPVYHRRRYNVIFTSCARCVSFPESIVQVR